MDFQELIRVRRSVRGYRPELPADDILTRVLGAGRIAPTAANLQPFHLVVVTDADRRAALKQAYPRDWFHTAPVIVVVCAEPGKAWKRADGWNAAEVDAAIVMDHIVLAATEEGLGTCWVCNFEEAKVKQVLGVPDEVRVIAMTPMGYPEGPPRPFARKRLDDLLHRERW